MKGCEAQEAEDVPLIHRGDGSIRGTGTSSFLCRVTWSNTSLTAFLMSKVASDHGKIIMKHHLENHQLLADRSDNLLHLLTDLFGLHSGGVLSTEAELCDGHVVQDDVEVFGPLKQLSADQQGDLEDNKVPSINPWLG